MTSSGRARAILAVTAAALGVLLAGCSSPPGQACTSIGWFNQVTVELTGSAPSVNNVASIWMVDDDGCAEAASSHTPIPAAQASIPTDCAGMKVNPTEWHVNIGMTTPSHATIAAYDADGTELASVVTALTWTRVAGSEQCGGPETAGPVTLDLPH